ncbi:MAG: DUF2851 family protein [Flavipsychrobacter sp.]|nr:DUF2851 family protein [Flavipsychrobacter sp.]
MAINETLLQLIWQYSLYKPGNLITQSGESVTILFPGVLNRNAGPDFFEAKVKVGNTLLVGNVELHINSSDWLKHGHQEDPAYQRLILHVVYNNDVPDVVAHTPVLQLAPHIPAHIITQYSNLLQAPQSIPCSAQLPNVKDIIKESWLSRLLAERWEQKLLEWEELLTKSAGDWHNLMYWRTAANFGFKVNTHPFMMLAQSLPLNILAKHHENLLQIEAVVFGQAGFLEGDFEDDYPRNLQREYDYLRKKYKLTPIHPHLWKFMRMRPANFPTIRLAQFAALVHKSVHLFSQVVEIATGKELQPLFDVKASEYWDTHFKFDEPSAESSPKRLGKSSIDNIIINTIAPIQFLYAEQQGVSGLKERALQLLDTIPAEKNNIISIWDANKWPAQNATRSQAMIQLYNRYCSSKRCLECPIGLSIIRAVPVEG